MGSKIEYVESTHMYASNYIRNSRAIGVLWGIFTICYAIIGLVAFVTPEWLGDLEHEQNPLPGRFGLWMRCSLGPSGEPQEECQGRLDELSTIASGPFRLSTLLVGLALLFAGLSIIAMPLFFFCKSTSVFHLCAWLQLASALCMGAGVCIYPLGWDSPIVRAVCGATASRYNPGACAVRWAVPLATIAALDAATLASLAFILASRHVKLQPEPFNSGSLYKGEVNPGYVNEAQSVTGSRKSLSLRPVLLVAHPSSPPPQPPPPPADQDRYSELSRGKSHSHHSLTNNNNNNNNNNAHHHHHHHQQQQQQQHNFQL